MQLREFFIALSIGVMIIVVIILPKIFGFSMNIYFLVAIPYVVRHLFCEFLVFAYVIEDNEIAENLKIINVTYKK